MVVLVLVFLWRMIVAGVFDLANERGQSKADDQSDRKFDAIVRVKLKFREQVAGGDAHKRSCREGERKPHEVLTGTGVATRSEIKKQRAQREGQGE